MVSNLRQVPGIVSLEANSESSELIVTFNTDELTLDDLIAQVGLTGDEVSGWSMRQ